jgi:hypothetical protein
MQSVAATETGNGLTRRSEDFGARGKASASWM